MYSTCEMSGDESAFILKCRIFDLIPYCGGLHALKALSMVTEMRWEDVN